MQNQAILLQQDITIEFLPHPSDMPYRIVVINNPVLYVDPSGHFPWAFIAIGALIGGGSAAIQGGDAGDILTGAFIGGVSGGVGGAVGGYVGGSFANATISSVVGGAAGGMAAGATASGMYGGDIGRGALFGAIGGAVFGSLGAHYGDSWDMGRVLLHGAAGGGMSLMQGGDFGYGAAFAGGAALAMNGWQRMRDWTNASSQKGTGKEVYNENGELLTTGRRMCDGCTPENSNWFTDRGGYEGSKGWIYENKAINYISKVHDFMNGFGYRGTGNYVAGSELYNTTFAAYSYAGMPLAAAYTGFAFSAQYYQPSIYNFRN